MAHRKQRVLRPVAAVIVVFLLSLVADARAALVTIHLRGHVTTEYTDNPAVSVGDQLDLTFTYEVNDDGTGPTTDFSSPLLYRSKDAVTSATATLGNHLLTGPVTNTAWGRASFLQVDDGSAVGVRDLFQGGMSFNPIDGIARPLISFYLYDSSGTRFDPNPRLPISWDETSIERFNTLRFAIFDYDTFGDTEFAAGVIIPEPTGVCAVVLLGGALLSREGRATRLRRFRSSTPD